MPTQPHPRELLKQSGKEWDFSLPGCEVFGCYFGQTDAESYAESHARQTEKLAALEPNPGVPSYLLEAITDGWDSFDKADPRWRAALKLIHSAEHYYDDREHYAAFKAIPPMIAELVLALTDAEYHEYSEDTNGVTARQARAVSEQAQALATTVREWADSL
jgi:hypothetical protein